VSRARWVAFFGSFSFIAHAQPVFTWDGGSNADSNFSTRKNWGNSLVAPATTSDFVFGGTVRTSPVVDTSAYQFRNITQNSGAQFTVTGGTGSLTWASTGTILNSSTSVFTIQESILINTGVTGTVNASAGNVAISGAISGSGGLTKTGNGTLTLSGSNNYTGATQVSSGILDLSVPGAASGGSLTLQTGSTLLLSGSGATSYSFSSITVPNNATATIDFGTLNAATTLAIGSLSIGTNATLIISNWVRLSDQFTVTNAPTIDGVAVVAGANISKSSINFSNYGELAQWNNTGVYAGQLAAVPEPSTYGAMLMAGCAGLFGLRRWRAKRRTVRG
jgi:autotransporter-associated beta strand protein